MAGELAISANIFGDQELVAGLSTLHQRLRAQLFGELKRQARAYADDVVASGLAEQGIKSRTGRLARTMVVRGRLNATSARALVYPGAKDEGGYRYPWALGMGSPKNQVDVKAYVRAPRAGEVGGDAVLVRRGRTLKLGKGKIARQRIDFKKFTGVVKVPAHYRRINMKPRPFMSGGALTRLDAVFGARMEAAIREVITYVVSSQGLASAPAPEAGAD